MQAQPKPSATAPTRKDDVTLEVLQHNTDKKLTIVAADEALGAHLGLKADELVGAELKTVLPANINELIDNYLEYGDDGHDLGAVLSKSRKFGLLHSKGREIRFGLKIVRDVALDANPRFKLHINRLRVMESLRQQLGILDAQEKDIIDTTTHLPDRASFMRHLDLVCRGVREGKLQASLGLIRVDEYNTVVRNHAQEGAKALFMHLGQVCKRNLREDDLMGYVEPNRIALLLMETSGDNAKIPMNRIRWNFAASPLVLKKETLELTLTATYIQITGKDVPPKLIEECNKLIGQADAKHLGGNLVVDRDLLSKEV